MLLTWKTLKKNTSKLKLDTVDTSLSATLTTLFHSRIPVALHCLKKHTFRINIRTTQLYNQLRRQVQRLPWVPPLLQRLDLLEVDQARQVQTWPPVCRLWFFSRRLLLPSWAVTATISL